MCRVRDGAHTLLFPSFPTVIIAMLDEALECIVAAASPPVDDGDVGLTAHVSLAA